MGNKIVIVLVLYKVACSKTPNYALFQRLLKKHKKLFLLVYDNSPKAQTDPLFKRNNVHYSHHPKNEGLASAYNLGVTYLQKQAGDYLLLLDDDTKITASFIQTIQHLTRNEVIGAYVPRVFAKKRQISPVFAEHFVTKHSQVAPVGSHFRRLMAINSGTVVPLSVIHVIGGFNPAFPLDYLDHWFFWKLHELNYGVEVLDEKITHDLSVLDVNALSAKRYRSILRAESLFYQKYDSTHLRRYKAQLLLRTIKQFFLVKNRTIWRKTWNEFVSLMKGD